MTTRPYVVRQGDYLLKIATRYGFDAETVWNLPENQPLRTARPNPNILRDGDVLYIPEPRLPSLPLEVGATNSFRAKVPVVSVPLTFLEDGRPLARAECVVHGMPPPNTFTTDGAGAVVLTVPYDVLDLVIEFPSVPLVRTIRVGHLDPVGESSGIVQRLRNLGHMPAHVSAGDDGERAVGWAIRSFQEARGLKPSGVLDAATRAALESAHGG
jgi:Putative peptidoglycan binding domain